MKMNITEATNRVSLPDVDRLFGSLQVSRNTKKDYLQRIPLFLGFVQEYGLNQNSILDFKQYLADRNDLSVSSKNKYLIVAKVYANLLHNLKLIPLDITKDIAGKPIVVFRQNRLHKKTGFNAEEVRAIESYLSSLPVGLDSFRQKAVFCLLAYQGLRVCEVVRLDIEDFKPSPAQLFVKGKGGDDREMIHLNPATLSAISEYAKISNIKSGALFVSQSNRNYKKRLSTRSIQRMTENWCRACQIKDRSTHGFRHFFITTLIKAFDGNIVSIKKFSRHSSTDMLIVYNDEVGHEADLPRFYEAFKTN